MSDTTTDLEYQDMILDMKPGDWLIASDPVRGLWVPEYERAEFPAGERFRIRYPDKLLDTLTCYHTSGALVQFKRTTCTNLLPEVSRRR